MSKYQNITLAVLVAMSLLVGCGPAATPAVAPPPAATAAPLPTLPPQVVTSVSIEVVQATAVPITHHYKFAWIMPDMFNPFWVYMRQGAEKAAVELKAKGIQVDIQQMAPIVTFNTAEQVSIFENAIQMKVDGIGICVIDQTAVIDQTNKAVAAGIPVAALSTDIPNSNRTIYSGVDNVGEAQQVAQMLIDANGGKGNYLILSGITGNFISEQRDQGFNAAIAANPQTKLLERQPAEFNRAKGMSVMENMMQKYGPGQIQGVFTVNDEVALGAMAAVQAAGRANEIQIVGIDGNQDAANAVKAGTMLATGADDPWMKGYQAVYELVYFLTKDPAFTATPKIDVIYVTKANVDQYLTKFDEYAAYYKP
jgi:ribose transport system substrate-binding protein